MAGDSITTISERYVDDYAALDPVGAAREMGVATGSPELTDYSPAGLAAREELYARTEAGLEHAEPADEAERLGRLYLLDQVRGELDLHRAGEAARMVSAIVGPPAMVRLSFDLMPTDEEPDWEHVAARLGAVPSAMAGYRAALAAAADSHGTAAATTVGTVADQCERWAGANWFGTFVEGYGDGPLRRALDDAAAAASAAYGELAAWLTADYLPRADTGTGVGPDRYATWSRTYLGGLDLDDTYDWAWDELARIEAEKQQECERILPGAGFDEVRELLTTDPDRCIHGVDAYRQWLQDVSDDATARLNGSQFDIPDPLLRCDIGIPPEGSAAAAFYTPPSEDLSQPGRTWFPALGRTMFPTWADVTVAYHEAVPGHHLQLGTTRVVPLIRAHRVGFLSAHGEGWALYAERLMDELGFFDTPETRLGLLASQAFRTVRVVVDIGLHTRRPIPAGWPGAGEVWTQALAEQHLVRAGGLSGPAAESEVQRYLGWPAQATTYKVGERAWLEGRADAQAAAGGSFDRKGWHARALALGALGLDDLRHELAGC